MSEPSSSSFDLLARYRLGLSFLVFLLIMMEWQINDGGRPHTLFVLQDGEHPAGLLLIVAGLGLRSWSAGVIRKCAVLATEGPYAWTRHPLYLGSFLIALGFAAVIEDRHAVAAVLLVVPLLYLPTIQREERGLVTKFGDAWRAYARRTGMILPRFPARLSRTDWSWQCWWRNREWRILLRTVAVLWLLEWWNALAQGG